MALQEQSERFELDSKSFDGSGRFMTTGGKFAAHPKMDHEAREMGWFGYSAGTGAAQQPCRLWTPAGFHSDWVAVRAV